MAKQSGIHQLKGKVRDMSYYRQKGVVDGLARSINQGLSQRVKEDAAYLNTRLNAVEFGRAGSFAGAAIRAISERQRTMLKDFATGLLAKQVRDIIVSDTTNPWGDRQLVSNGWDKLLMQIISTFAKVEFTSNVGGVWDVSAALSGNNYTVTPNAELPAGWGSMLAAKGATGAFVDIFGYKVSLEDLGAGIMKGASETLPIASDDCTIGDAITFTNESTLPNGFFSGSANNSLSAVLVVVRPYQEVNERKFIRQELCTFKVLPFLSVEV